MLAPESREAQAPGSLIAPWSSGPTAQYSQQPAFIRPMSWEWFSHFFGKGWETKNETKYVTEMVRPAKPKVFTPCPVTENICQPSLHLPARDWFIKPIFKALTIFCTCDFSLSVRTRLLKYCNRWYLQTGCLVAKSNYFQSQMGLNLNLSASIICELSGLGQTALPVGIIIFSPMKWRKYY